MSQQASSAPTERAAAAGGRSSAILAKVHALVQRPVPAKFPSIASIPQTSPERLAQAATDAAKDGDEPKSKTYLYLAYGSNLCAETFLGVRGIRPLSQVNVSVPTLELKFNLPGFPYQEPCFANVDYRKLPGKPELPPGLPDPSKPPPKLPVPPVDPPVQQPPHTSSTWDKGLIGVVYEVTEEDYRTIILTEGSGASYKEIIVPCLPIPPKFSVPEKPPFPELPKPFLANTLFSPQIPDSDLPDDPRKKKWWYRFIIGPQREPDYAQASARYLKLITDGAREHDLPDDYQNYLQSLQPYTITSCRQRVGGLLFLVIVGVFFLGFIGLSKLVADKDGKAPRWFSVAMTVWMNITWIGYDAVMKPLFGDGERTEEEDQGSKPGAWARCTVPWKRCPSADEEKVALMKEFN